MIAHRSNPRKFAVTVGIAVVGAAVLSACSSTRQVSYQQMVAPANMEVARLHDVAITEFTGEAGWAVSEGLASSLQRVYVDGRTVFAVSGPYGNAGPAGALDIARSVDARVVLTGNTNYDTRTDIRSPSYTETCQAYDAAGNCAVVQTDVTQCVDITVTLQYAARAFEVDTGRTVYDPGWMNVAQNTSECVSTADNPAVLVSRLMNNDFGRSIDALKAQLAYTAAERIHRDIAPYPQTFLVQFLKEGDLLNDREEDLFEEASDLVDDGQTAAACSVWDRMARSGSRDLAVSYNQAACAEHAGDYVGALEGYNLVYSLVFTLPTGPGGGHSGDNNYDLDDWAELLATSRARAQQLQYSQDVLGQLSSAPTS